jgi:fumarate hydratase, class I
MAVFQFEKLLSLNEDGTEYRLLTKDYVSASTCDGQDIIKIAPAGLILLAASAFRDSGFLFRPSHLRRLAGIFDDPEASDNDRFVAYELLQNAVIAADGVFPICQDTGTAVVFGEKGHRVWTDGRDEEALSRGVFEAFAKHHFRYSQVVPLTMYEEVNSGTNLPAQIDICGSEGDEYRFLFMAKGGGSANKTFLFQESKAVLDRNVLPDFLAEKMELLGPAACPPYHLAFVVGGPTPEFTLRTVKLASAGYLDGMPTEGRLSGRGFRDLDLERSLLGASRRAGWGAQFGGSAFCLDVRVVRLPRHAASCFIGMGVSCNADRNIKAKITRDGIFIEALETQPGKYLGRNLEAGGRTAPIDLDQPMDEVRAQLRQYPVATRVSLSGPMVVARDMAHARWKERLDRGDGLPAYVKDRVIYYAGPAKTPPGYAAGSFGPTTAGRMDAYIPLFQKNGGSLVTLAKGNRSAEVVRSCRAHGGFYLGSIGGAGARLGRDRITKSELLDYPELGMEAVYLITVKDFPAFLMIDDKGNDFFHTTEVER